MHSECLTVQSTRLDSPSGQHQAMRNGIWMRMRVALNKIGRASMQKFLTQSLLDRIKEHSGHSMLSQSGFHARID